MTRTAPKPKAVYVIVGLLLLSNLALLPTFFKYIDTVPTPLLTGAGFALFFCLQLIALGAKGTAQMAALLALLVGALLSVGTGFYVAHTIDVVRTAQVSGFDSPGWMVYRFLKPGSILGALNMATHFSGNALLWLCGLEASIEYALCLWLCQRSLATSYQGGN